MADEFGTAYVKIRPDFSHFKGEAQRGVKDALVGIGKTVGGLLAIKGGFDFGKELISDAAHVQKSVETIRDEFGAAGKEVIDFADTAGLKLGIAAHASEDTAARFGILFKNLGIGKDQAAEMTVNLESLAGSIAAIRGKNPEDVLGNLPQALAGNLRSLKQLGFVFDQNQIKREALTLGLITTTKQALDPGSKALAVYGLLTKNLGDFQAQAAAHSGDAFNVQKRLSAEYDHAKETLGTDLLPIVDKYGLELADFIDKGEKSGQIQKEINRVAAVGKEVIGDVASVVKTGADAYRDFAKVVGGDHNAVKILADAFGLLYARSKLISWGLIATGEAKVGAAAATSAGEVDALSGSLGGLKGIGPIAIPVALLLSDKNIRDTSSNLADDLIHHKGLGKTVHDDLKAAGAVGGFLLRGLGIQLPKAAADTSKRAGLTVAQILQQTLKKGLDPHTGFKLKEGTDALGRYVGNELADAIGDGVKDGAPHLSKSVLDSLKQPVLDAQSVLAQAKQQLAADIASMPKAITDAVNQAKQNLNSLAGSLASDVGGFLDAKDASGAGSLGGVLKGRLAQLMKDVQSGHATAETVNIAQQLENQLVAKAQLPSDASTIKDRVTKRLADLSDLFNKGAIGLKGFDKDVDQVLRSAGIKASVIEKQQGVAAADQFRADLAGIKQQALAITAGPKRPGTGLEATIVRPLATLKQLEAKIGDDRRAEAQAAEQVSKAELAEAKKTNALLSKVEAKLPSKHESAQLDALLRKQGLSPTNTRARQAGTNRHGR